MNGTQMLFRFSTIVILCTVFVINCQAAQKCEICKKVVSNIKSDRGLAYVADLSSAQINRYIRKHVEKECSGSYCSKLVEDLNEIAEQLDDDLDATPAELCLFIDYC